MAQKRKHKTNADKQAEYRHRKKAAANVTLLAPSSVRVPAPHNRLVSGGMDTKQLDIISGKRRGHGRAVNAKKPYSDLLDVALEAGGPDCDCNIAIHVVAEAAAKIVKEEMAKPEGERAWQDF
jgi:hypothetical protein